MTKTCTCKTELKAFKIGFRGKTSPVIEHLCIVTFCGRSLVGGLRYNFLGDIKFVIEGTSKSI